AAVGSNPGVQAAVAEVEQRLGETGRVLLRPSGTEPVVRVMVEAASEEAARAETEYLASVVERELALTV
ncbi:phosphoglucosamine mutase, partial [Kocuria oceani]